jgi:hypothetical protein
MWNIFFKIEEYSEEKYHLYRSKFSHISEDTFKLYWLLQYFSDLTWLENYLIINPTDIDKTMLFERNKNFFKKLLKQLD